MGGNEVRQRPRRPRPYRPRTRRQHLRHPRPGQQDKNKRTEAGEEERLGGEYRAPKTTLSEVCGNAKSTVAVHRERMAKRKDGAIGTRHDNRLLCQKWLISRALR